MGGSAWPTNMMMDYLKNIDIPLLIHRNYGLPETNKNDLVIVVSYSGNTEEPISSFKEALKRNLKIVAVSNNGKLKKLAEENNIPIVILPSSSQPRYGSGNTFFAILKIISNSGIIKNKEKEILETAKKLKPLALEKKGKSLAKRIKGEIPVIYSPFNFKTLARIWKINFNENSKTMAFWNYFPELNHNEMNGIEHPNGKFHFIILRDRKDNPRNLKRMEIFSDLAKTKGFKIDFIDLGGKNDLEKIMNSFILSEWTSFYLASEYKENPEKIKLIEDFKIKMGK